MNSSQLNRFINKYHLGGEIKSVKWSSDGNSLTTRFISGDKSVLGEVKLDKFDGVQASDLGVYNTPQLASLLNILSEDVEFKLTNAGDKFISIDMVDQRYKTTSKYMLSDLSVIPTVPDLRNFPSEYELEVNVDSYFINTFIDRHIFLKAEKVRFLVPITRDQNSAKQACSCRWRSFL